MKENLKELLDRLDEQSAQYSAHLTQANALFDTAVKKMETLLSREKKEMHRTIVKIKKAMKDMGSYPKTRKNTNKNSEKS